MLVVDAWPILKKFLGWPLLYSAETWEILHKFPRKYKNATNNKHNIQHQIMNKVKIMQSCYLCDLYYF